MSSSIDLALVPLLTAEQARARDRHTIDVVGVPGLVLMEHAGRAVADVVTEALSALPDRESPPTVVVLCGGGNNGGDGYVCARHLLSRGVDVTVLALIDPVQLRGDAATAHQLFCSAARALHHLSPGQQVQVGEVAATLASLTPDVVVDALFGTGLSRPLDEAATAIVVAVETVRRRGAVVIAVDVPSGVRADGSRQGDATISADVTVTFGGEKIAHRSEPGSAVCGAVVDVDIGFILPPDESVTVFGLEDVQLPVVDVTAHKGRFGHVGVVVGDPGLAGAAVLAATSALRAGAGLCTLLGTQLSTDTLPVTRPMELMAQRLDDVAATALDALVVGPGLRGRGDTIRDAIRRLRREADAAEHTIWTVADAGALGLLERGDADVWTPHPGEAARVLGVSVADVQRDRVAAARKLVDLLGGVVVLKGHAPIVATATRAMILTGDAPALAVAGSGDVLAGLIAAGLGGAFGPGTVDAVVVASVWLHQQVGRQAGQQARRGTFASELAALLPAVIEAARPQVVGAET